MKRVIRIPLILIPCLAGLLVLNTESASANPRLPRSASEPQGVASDDIRTFIERADREIHGMHSFMLVRHGHVIAETWWAPYDAEHKHQLYSLSKSFTSTAVGLAQAEGKLSIDDPVVQFFPEEAPSDPSRNLQSMRIRDLLAMSTGHEQEPSASADTVSPKTFLAEPVPHKPGTHFRYNTAATFMLSAIVQKQTGQTVLDYLRPRLFEPLGIEDPIWKTNSQGISLGGYGLFVRTEDIACFGQLYLNHGLWRDHQIVPTAWVEAATSRQTSNGSNPDSDWDQGYGYQFWRCRHGAYRGDGAFGQYCIVLPEQDAVIAITSGVRNMQAVLDLIWDSLLPAFRYEALPANSSADQELKAMLASLSVPTAEGDATSSKASQVWGRAYRFPDNEVKLESLSLEPRGGDRGVTLTVTMDGDQRKILCGFGEWQRGGDSLMSRIDGPMAGSGAWAESDRYVIKLCAYETPYHVTLDLKFAGDEVTYEASTNVGFGSTKLPTLTGKAESL